MEYTVVVSRGPFSGIQAAAFAEESIDWWDDSQSEAQTACTVCFAAAELAKYLPGEVTLREPEDTVPAENGTVILLGTAGDAFLSAALRQLGLSQTLSMKKEGFRMAGCRRGDTDYVILAGADRAGAMYAAFSYLERLGIHFIEPGEPCVTEVCPQPDFDISEAPSYTGRGTMSTFINASEEFLLWMAHNRFNSGFFRKANHHFALRKKLCIDSVVGGHQMFYLFADTTQEYPYKHAIYGGEGKPADPYPVSPLCRAPSGEGGVMTYGDAHPEWYALVDGKHRMKRDRARFLRAGNAPGDNMCTSNQDAVTELCRLIVDALADGVWKYADHVHIWPLDNGIWCQCPQCQKLGNYSARILNLAYQVDKAIKTAYTHGRLKRKILLICPAYHETLPVPDKALPEDFDYQSIMTVFYPIERCFAHDLDDPICTETNALLMERLLPWSTSPNYKGELVIGEYYNVSSFAAMPFVLTSRILHEITMYYRIGARHFHYMHITARDWGFIAINNYLHSKLLWNVDADSEVLVNTYFTARYSSLAPQMRALYEKLEAATANCKYYKHYQFVNGKIMRLFGQLNSGEPQTEESLFPLVHMKLRARADDPQAGPSLEETLSCLEEAREQLQLLMPQLPNSFLERDARRLSFGLRITKFLYLMCLAVIGEAGAACLASLHALAENLAADTQSMQGYDFGDDFTNALQASWVANTYYTRFAPEKGPGNAENGIAL